VVALRGYLESWDSLGWPLAALAIGVGIGILGYHLVFMVVSRMSKRTPPVLAITYFIEEPFQNWTRVSADILGAVFLRVDYAVPVLAVRHYLYSVLKNSNLWDGRTWGLQVTDATERTPELRALMTARDASDV
jgi:hypothetical protein